MRIGFGEILLILILAMVLFGGGKLAGVGKALGQSIREFKKEIASDGSDEKEELDQWMASAAFEMYYTIYINQKTLIQEKIDYELSIDFRLKQDQLISISGGGSSTFIPHAQFEIPDIAK